MGWEPQMAVFGANLRPVGEGAFSRAIRVERRKTRFKPSPALPIPLLPRWGSVSSFNFGAAA